MSKENYIYEIYWKFANGIAKGYIKAESKDRALEIARNEYLAEGTEITDIFKVDESRITPQSITLNFSNTREYKLFG